MNFRKLIFFFIFSVNILSLKGQLSSNVNPFYLMHKEYKEANYLAVVEIFNDNSKTKYYSTYDSALFFYFKSLVKLGKIKKATKALKVYLKHNGVDYDEIEADEDLNSFIVSDNFKQLKEKEDRLLRGYYKRIENIEALSTIENLFFFDQEIRNIDGFDICIAELDSINLNKFSDFLRCHKFPLYDEVGHVGVFKCWLLLLHLVNDGRNDEFEFEKYATLLKELVKQGKYPPKYFASFVDRFECLNQGISYGSYGTIIFDESVLENEEILNKINENRRNIFLPKL